MNAWNISHFDVEYEWDEHEVAVEEQDMTPHWRPQAIISARRVPPSSDDLPPTSPAYIHDLHARLHAGDNSHPRRGRDVRAQTWLSSLDQNEITRLGRVRFCKVVAARSCTLSHIHHGEDRTVRHLVIAFHS